MDDQRRGRPWTSTETQESGLRLALEAAGLCLWEWELATATLRSSANVAGVYGVDPATFGGTFEGFLDVCVHPAERGRLVEWLERGRRGEAVHRLEFRAVMSDGSSRWLEQTGRVRFDEAGRPSALVGATLDVDERKRAEETAHANEHQQRMLVDRSFAREQTARAEAESANRAKDEFLAVVSHELRTPLNAILGWSQILRAQEVADPMLARALESIERNARAQSALVGSLLDVSRMISGSLRLDPIEVALAPLVRIVVDENAEEARRRGVDLVGDVAEDAGAVWGDPDRLQHIVRNLISNALKFTPSGGRVEVELRRVDDSARLTVHDTGAGIDAEFLPHVFEKFRQADASVTRRHGGLGLGLAVARHLVHLHRGTISAASAGPGAGATFTVTLPLARE